MQRDRIQIDDPQLYKRCRVRLRAQGVVLRDEVEGSAIRTKSQQVCHADQLLVAEIDAKVGGFGIVPGLLEGAVVSSHYFLFDLDRERVNPVFLGWYLRTDTFQDQVRAQGSTNYASIRPADVLNYTVPVPSLALQGSLAGALDGAWGELARVEQHHIKVTTAAAALPGALLTTLCNEEPRVPLGEICTDIRGGAWGDPPSDDGVVVLRAGNIARDGSLNLRDTVARSLAPRVVESQRLRDGDLILTKSNSLEMVGGVAMFTAPLGDPRPHIAGNFLVRLRPDPSRCDPRFLWNWLRTSTARRYFQEAATGTSPSLQNLTHPKVAAFPVPLPSVERQVEIVDQLRDVSRAFPSEERSLESAQYALTQLREALLRAAFRDGVAVS